MSCLVIQLPNSLSHPDTSQHWVNTRQDEYKQKQKQKQNRNKQKITNKAKTKTKQTTTKQTNTNNKKPNKHKNKNKAQKQSTIRVSRHYAQASASKINKTWALLITTEGKIEPNVV